MFLQVFLHGLTFVTIGMIPAVKMDTVLVTHQLARLMGSCLLLNPMRGFWDGLLTPEYRSGVHLLHWV